MTNNRCNICGGRMIPLFTNFSCVDCDGRMPEPIGKYVRHEVMTPEYFSDTFGADESKYKATLQKIFKDAYPEIDTSVLITSLVVKPSDKSAAPQACDSWPDEGSYMAAYVPYETWMDTCLKANPHRTIFDLRAQVMPPERGISFTITEVEDP